MYISHNLKLIEPETKMTGIQVQHHKSATKVTSAPATEAPMLTDTVDKRKRSDVSDESDSCESEDISINYDDSSDVSFDGFEF